MQTGFLYNATVKSEMAPTGVFHVTIAIRGADQARQALAHRFGVPLSAVKVKAEREAGEPREILIGIAEVNREQCWADVNGRDRCPNAARPGATTCKTHTAFDAPAPFGTPEYDSWIAETDSPAESKPARRRTHKTASKPAAARSARRRKPKRDAP
jgi:hypothetical protein